MESLFTSDWPPLTDIKNGFHIEIFKENTIFWIPTFVFGSFEVVAYFSSSYKRLAISSLILDASPVNYGIMHKNIFCYVTLERSRCFQCSLHTLYIVLITTLQHTTDRPSGKTRGTGTATGASKNIRFVVNGATR